LKLYEISLGFFKKAGAADAFEFFPQTIRNPMPADYHMLPEEKLVLFNPKGVFKVKDIMTAGAQLFTDSSWENGFKVLADYRGITEFNPSVKELENLVKQDSVLNPKFDKSHMAVVVPNEFLFNIMRVWEMMSLENIIHSRVFKDLSPALDWLGVSLEQFERIESRVNTMVD
jgi:hypothetical protein